MLCPICHRVAGVADGCYFGQGSKDCRTMSGRTQREERP